MAKKQKQYPSVVHEPEAAYLTKRTLERALSKGTRHISEDALQRRGYVVTARDGWVVKIDNKGKHTRISKLEIVKTPGKISLD